MQIKYSLTTEDYINFNLYRMKHDEKGVAMVKKQRLLGCIGIMLLGAVFVAYAKVGQAILAVVMIAIATFWYFNYPRLVEKRITKSTEKALKNANTSDFFRELSVTLTKDEISESDHHFTWDNVEVSIEMNETLYLFLDDNSTLIIPKRGVVEEYDEILNIVQTLSKSFNSIEL